MNADDIALLTDQIQAQSLHECDKRFAVYWDEIQQNALTRGCDLTGWRAMAYAAYKCGWIDRDALLWQRSVKR